MRVVPQGAGVGVIEAEETPMAEGSTGEVVVGAAVTATEAGATLAVVVTLVGAQEEAINVASRRKLNLSLARVSRPNIPVQDKFSSLSTCLMGVELLGSH